MIRKREFIALIGAITALTYAGGNSFANITTDSKSIKTENIKTEDKDKEFNIEKLSETFGNYIGRNLNVPGFKFDIESLIKGIRNGAAGKPAPMSDEEYEKEMAALQEKIFAKMSEENLKAANDFLAKNAKEPNVKEMIAGKVQYIILEEGQGDEVKEHSSPLVEYTGKYLDGTVFGSSNDVGGAITIPVDQTISGFGKGIIGAKEGEKRRLFIHPDLGYGTSGHLPPNSLLIFDVRIIKAQNEEKQHTQFDPGEDEEIPPLAINDEDDFEDDLEREEKQYSPESDLLDELDEQDYNPIESSRTTQPKRRQEHPQIENQPQLQEPSKSRLSPNH